jgi:glycosyltransferase involved in cell wall biosynthesis
MWCGRRVVVVLPAYKAERTLAATVRDIRAQNVVDNMILVDDCSSDSTVLVASEFGDVSVCRHEINRGYGGNQKTCYRLALADGADIVIMVHPDYQYTPLLIPAMVAMVSSGLYDMVLGSRILGGHALKGGMPVWKYITPVIERFHGGYWSR